MSIDTATIERIQLPKPREVKEVPVKFQPVTKNIGSLAWRQINDILCSSLSESGFPQPVETAVGGWRLPLDLLGPIVVAPGIVVGSDEYKQRYGGIDLEQYRQQMFPEHFKAFVRHIGRIPGTPDLDLGDIVTTPE